MGSDIKLADGKGLIRGDDYTIKVTLNTDITGATVFFTVNEEDNPATDSTAAFQKVNSPLDHEYPAIGKTNFFITGEDTAPLEPGTYYYDLQVVTPGGRVASTRKGKILIDSDITRNTEVTS